MVDELTVVPENNPKGSVPSSIASAVIPWDRDDERALYFGYRACGCSVREALSMIDRSKQWLSLQRQDPRFVNLEGRIPEFRDTLGKEYLKLETFRNYRMILEKDRQVIQKAIKPEKDSDGNALPLSRQEQEYLIKMRTMYTPAQIQILEALVQGGDSGFNFAQFVAENPGIVQMSRTDTVTLVNNKDA